MTSPADFLAVPASQQAKAPKSARCDALLLSGLAAFFLMARVVLACRLELFPDETLYVFVRQRAPLSFGPFPLSDFAALSPVEGGRLAG